MTTKPFVTVTEIPVTLAGGDQLCAQVRVETTGDAYGLYHDVTILGVEVPDGTQTRLGPGLLLRVEAEQVTHDAIAHAEEALARREAMLADRDWDWERDYREGY